MLCVLLTVKASLIGEEQRKGERERDIGKFPLIVTTLFLPFYMCIVVVRTDGWSIIVMKVIPAFILPEDESILLYTNSKDFAFSPTFPLNSILFVAPRSWMIG